MAQVHFDRQNSYQQTVMFKYWHLSLVLQRCSQQNGSNWFFSPIFFSFSQDVPKDYRHVSLTGVKQRFEDEAYQQISRDKVLNYSCLFFALKNIFLGHDWFSKSVLELDINNMVSTRWWTIKSCVRSWRFLRWNLRWSLPVPPVNQQISTPSSHLHPAPTRGKPV